MLIIGHRGAAGLAPENTLAALQAGFAAGADILEFDVRLTRDDIPILAHNPRLGGKWVSSHSLEELRTATTVTTLAEALDAFFGKILLNIEIKRGADTERIYQAISPYITSSADWDNILFSSFKPKVLATLRSHGKSLNLALLHHINPFLFIRHHTQLDLTAVGFHRLHVRGVALAAAKRLSLFTYAYTVDRPETALRLERRGLDGIVTNYPDKISGAL